MQDHDDELLTDPELFDLLRCGETKGLALQREPDFPPPVWLGPRLKRHWRNKVLAWVASRTEKPKERQVAA
jgi:predicted DNA-binding transcriptional regulator AlpA